MIPFKNIALLKTRAATVHRLIDLGREVPEKFGNS